MTPKYLLIIDFPKFDPLTAADMALCGNLESKCQVSREVLRVWSYFKSWE
jgi:hypothetical protein